MEKKEGGKIALNSWNYKMIAAGVAVVVLGFILMAGGGSEDPNVFDESIYDFRHITLAPIVVLAGYVLRGYGVMKRHEEK